VRVTWLCKWSSPFLVWVCAVWWDAVSWKSSSGAVWSGSLSPVGITTYEKCCYVCVMEMWWLDRYCVLYFGRGGVRCNQGSSGFRYSTLGIVNCCCISCCVHHPVFRLLWLKEYCELGNAVGIHFVGSGSGKQVMTGYGLVSFLNSEDCVS
jgi:hypothetical protein